MAKIMIIEDDKPFSEILSSVLEEEGHACHVEEDAVNVFNNINSLQKFDAIILDLMMPKEGELLDITNSRLAAGEIIYDKIRSNFKAKTIFIVTAKDKKQINIDTNGDPNTFFIYKPVDDDAISNILKVLQ